MNNNKNIIQVLDAAQVTSTESYFQDSCEQCNSEFIFGDSIHTLVNDDRDYHPVSIICGKCFNQIGRK